MIFFQNGTLFGTFVVFAWNYYLGLVYLPLGLYLKKVFNLTSYVYESFYPSKWILGIEKAILIIMKYEPLFFISCSLSLRMSVYSSGIYSLKSGNGWIGFFTGIYTNLK